MAERRPVKAAELMGLAAAAGQEAREVAARRRMANLRLTDTERYACSDELAEQFAIGRLDEGELHRRVDLLNDAVTHADLKPVFAGLPTPTFYQPTRRTGAETGRRRWRWAAFVAAVWMAVPFALTGLLLLVFGREVAAAIVGLPSLIWVFLAYRWASRPNRRAPRP